MLYPSGTSTIPASAFSMYWRAKRSAYVEHIKHNPAVAFHIADDFNLEHTRVLVEGRADIVEGPVSPADSPRIQDLAVTLTVRYLAENADEYAVRSSQRPRDLVRIVPQRWQTWTGRERARKYLGRAE